MTSSTNDLLDEIWSLSPGKYVSMPTMYMDIWNNGVMFDKAVIGYGRPDGNDEYFSPLTYDTESGGRRRDNITAAGVIFADIDSDTDEMTMKEFVPVPSLTVASGSPNHEHLYWFLEVPAPIPVWELYARGVTESLGADPGGWDVTQVLRIPGSQNWKGGSPTPVEVLDYTGYRYSIAEFPRTTAKPVVVNSYTTLPPLPIVTREAVKNAVEWAWPRLTVEERLLLTGKEKARDRSKVIWGMIRRWHDVGISEATTFILLSRSPLNKYKDRPEVLWAQIYKSSAVAAA